MSELETCLPPLSLHKIRPGSPCTCCGKDAYYQYAEARRGEPLLWCCKDCHEARQRRSEHCAYCDRPLDPQSPTRSLYRDGYLVNDGSPLVPFCLACKVKSITLAQWAQRVAEPHLYQADALHELDTERIRIERVVHEYCGLLAHADRNASGALRVRVCAPTSEKTIVRVHDALLIADSETWSTTDVLDALIRYDYPSAVPITIESVVEQAELVFGDE